jgi:hypothetical protein
MLLCFPTAGITTPCPVRRVQRQAQSCLCACSQRQAHAIDLDLDTVSSEGRSDRLSRDNQHPRAQRVLDPRGTEVSYC